MSKKKSNKAKKSEPDVPSPPIKTAIQTLYEEHIDTESLILSQQRYIISVLNLSDHSLYDSVIIEIITDFLRFAKSIQLSSNQIEPMYHMLQNILYKIMNDHHCNLEQINAYLNKTLSFQMGKEQSNEATTEYITSEQSQSIIQFMEQRILSQYTLYRVALFENNPSNLRYSQFKKNFEIGDIVRFQDEECLFKIEEFRSNDVVLSCLHSDFKSPQTRDTDKPDDNDINDIIKYNVSRDQLQFIAFVSKPKQEEQKDEIIESDVTKDEINNEENEDTTNQNEENPVEEMIEKDIVDDTPKTLIEIIINKKVEEKLALTQQNFDKELEQCKQQIQQLQNEENEDTTNQIEDDRVEEMIEKEDMVNEDNIDPVNEDIMDDTTKTLLDIMVDEKVEEKLKVMQQKFDKELEQCKQQIEQLQMS